MYSHIYIYPHICTYVHIHKHMRSHIYILYPHIHICDHSQILRRSATTTSIFSLKDVDVQMLSIYFFFLLFYSTFNKDVHKKISITYSFTLYSAHSSIDGGNLKFTPDSFFAEFQRHCMLSGTSQRRTLPRHQNEKINLNKYLIFLDGDRTHNQQSFQSHLCPCATTGLYIYYTHVYIIH